MRVSLWNIERIKPYSNNPRVNDHAIKAVAASIREFGFRQPIVVDETGTIIVGHTRYKAALLLGMEKVPVHVAKDLTPAQIKAYRLADNKTAEIADWDHDRLVEELLELEKMAFDLDLVVPPQLSPLTRPRPRNWLGSIAWNEWPGVRGGARASGWSGPPPAWNASLMKALRKPRPSPAKPPNCAMATRNT